MRQAIELKEKLRNLNRPLTVSITSGKGGVGKSIISLSLASACASNGLRVLLVDADLGLGNQHLMLGLSPVFTVEDYLSGTCQLSEACMAVTANLSLLAAKSGFVDDDWTYSLDTIETTRQLEWARGSFDLIIVDTAAGISRKVEVVNKLTDIALVVTTPDIAAVADAYALTKFLVSQQSAARIGFIVNRSESDSEGKKIASNVKDMVDRFLGYSILSSCHTPEHSTIRNILLNHSVLSPDLGDPAWKRAVNGVIATLSACIPSDISLWAKGHWEAPNTSRKLNIIAGNDDRKNMVRLAGGKYTQSGVELETSRKDSL